MRSHRLLVTLPVDTVLADIDNLGVLEIDTLMSSDTSIVFGEYAQGTRQWAGWSFNNGGLGTSNQTQRPVMTYDLPTLAGQGVVDSAKVYVYQCGVNGYTGSANVDPYSIGNLSVDHVDIGRVVQSNVSTYLGDTLQANIGTIASDSTRGVKSLAVTTSVQGDYGAKRQVSQYRLHWVFTTAPTLPPNGPGAYTGYYSYLGSDCAQNGGGPGPWLIIWSH